MFSSKTIYSLTTLLVVCIPYIASSALRGRSTDIALDRKVLQDLIPVLLQWRDTIILKNRQIISVAPDTFNGLNRLGQLDLSNNQIAGELNANTFKETPNIFWLSLANNKLDSIHPDTFKYMTKLATLLLSNNRIASLPVDAFRVLPSLTTLYLDHNQLSGELDPGLFKTSKPSLSSLALNNNQLASLHPETFRNQSFYRLALDANQLTELDRTLLTESTWLSFLTLSNNRFATLDRFVFSAQRSMQQLDLRSNPWTIAIDNKYFVGLYSQCEIILK
jgi:Leucine-rich repeat (LRR) protein